MRLNTIKPAEGRRKPPPRRPRHRLGPRQDGRPRPQGPEVALGRLPQGRLRRRPDAAAAPAAEARLRLAARDDTAEIRLSDLAKLPVADIDFLALQAAGLVPARAKIGEGDQDRQARQGGEAHRHRRDQGRQGGDRSRRRQRRVSGAIRQDEDVATTNPALKSGSKYADLKRRLLVPAGRARRLPDRHAHPGAGHQRVRAGRALPSQQGGILGLFNVFSGGALQRFSILALGHHAVHLGVDHHAALHGGRSDARGAEEGRRSRAGARSRNTRAMRRSARILPGARHLGRARGAGGARDRAGIRVPHDHGGDARDGHDVPDVARRADHRARPRQRHFAPDLRRHRRRAAARDRPDAGAAQYRRVSIPLVLGIARARHRRDGVRGVRRYVALASDLRNGECERDRPVNMGASGVGADREIGPERDAGEVDGDVDADVYSNAGRRDQQRTVAVGEADSTTAESQADRWRQPGSCRASAARRRSCPATSGRTPRSRGRSP